MLTRIKVDGFKNLLGVDVRFGPFTCIAGTNGVGKSNLFDAIRFLSLTANYPLLEAALRVRDEAGRNTDVSGLFQRIGGVVADTISFEAEMIVPPTAVDDLGQTGKASITFLRYTLNIRLRHDVATGPTSNPLEIVREDLVHIQKGTAHEHLLFPHSVRDWRSHVITGRRAGTAFISTSRREGAGLVIKLHQDAKGRGRAYERAAATLPGPCCLLPRLLKAPRRCAPGARCSRGTYYNLNPRHCGSRMNSTPRPIWKATVNILLPTLIVWLYVGSHTRV